MAITVETATDIALAHREIDAAAKLLAEVRETVEKRGQISHDLRDAFGRQHDGLELGVPSGGTSKRLFRVPYSLAVPVIEAHIAACRVKLEALNITATIELQATGGAA